jgi:hypothetical protein
MKTSNQIITINSLPPDWVKRGEKYPPNWLKKYFPKKWEDEFMIYGDPIEYIKYHLLEEMLEKERK